MFHPPKNIKARPTTDFAKENLFNILENRLDFQGLSALDLFAGTGNISFELVSRGCAHVTAIEHARQHIHFIRKVMNQLEINNLTLIKKDVYRYLKTQSAPFDIIFADPPYGLPGSENLPALIFNNNLLNPEGIFILEHDKNLRFGEVHNLSEQRKYGTVHFSFFNYPKENSNCS